MGERCDVFDRQNQLRWRTWQMLVPPGAAVDADATIVEETATVSMLLARKYGLIFRAFELFTATVRRLRRRAPSPSVTIRIVPR